MTRYLVVANQTLAAERLTREIDARIEKEPSSFFVVAPATALKDYRGARDPSLEDDPTGTPSDVQAAREAKRQAQQRLTRLLDHIRVAGAAADGVIGDSDPEAAVRSALADGDYDEVIVSTLPEGLSRWLRQDLPSKVQKMFDGPVTTLISND